MAKINYWYIQLNEKEKLLQANQKSYSAETIVGFAKPIIMSAE